MAEPLKIDGKIIEETKYHWSQYKGYKLDDFRNMSIKDCFQFAKANEGWETGISYDELRALHEGMETMGHRPLTIFETGMCFGTTTRYFILKLLKEGGELYTCEFKVREPFKNAMEELGLWKYINVLGDSMKVPWDKKIDVLFIDSEHALSDALGEYMKYRVFLNEFSLVGFHDCDFCYGVKRTIEIIQEIDDLELISSSVDKLGAGLKTFKVKRGQAQYRILSKIREEEKLKRTKTDESLTS